MSTEHGQEPQDNACTGKDRKSNRETPYANSDGILPIHVESLGRPEEYHGKEVGTADKSNDEGQKQDARRLLQSFREHWVFSPPAFPDDKSDDEDNTEDERSEYVG